MKFNCQLSFTPLSLSLCVKVAQRWWWWCDKGVIRTESSVCLRCLPMQIREGKQTFQIEEEMKTPKLNLTLCFMSPDSCEEQMFNQRHKKAQEPRKKHLSKHCICSTTGWRKNYWSVKDQFVFTSLKCDFKVNIFPKIFLLKDVKTKYLDWDSRSKSHLPVICLSWQQDCLRGNSTTSPVTQNKSFV